MAAPILYGPAYSTYTRTARLALEEKGIDYTLEEVDILQGAGQAPEHLNRHPFGKVPAFTHDGLVLYETAAVTRYIDEAFPGPKLQPSELRRRARMSQIVAIVDSYLYPSLIQKIVIQRAVVPLMGGVTDEAIVAEAAPVARKAIEAVESLADETGPFLVGSELSLADVQLAPVIAYGSQMPEGKEALSAAPRLSRWRQHMADRPSMQKTQPNLG